MTCLTYGLCISLENDIEFETNIKFVTAVSLLNSACVQLHRNSPYVALAKTLIMFRSSTFLTKQNRKQWSKYFGISAIATLERICEKQVRELNPWHPIERWKHRTFP